MKNEYKNEIEIFGEPIPEIKLDKLILSFQEKVPGILWSSRGKTNEKFQILLSQLVNCSKENFSAGTVNAVLTTIREMVDSLESVNDKGYFKFTLLSELPVFSDLLPGFYNELKIQKTDFIHNTTNSYEIILKWSYNLYILHLLLFTILLSINIKEDSPDLAQDIKNLEKDLSGSLDSSIRLKLRKQGISITQNIYCGFDTEYTNIDSFTNRLLSAQLALSTQTVLKLPLNSDYSFSVVNSQTGEIIPDASINAVGIDSDSILKLIRRGIKIYRQTKYPTHDDSLKRLIIGLKKSGKPFIQVKDNIHFIFPNTNVKQYFKRTLTGEYSLKELVNTSKNLVQSDLEKSLNDLFSLLKIIYDTTNENENENENEDEDENLSLEPGNLEKLTEVIDLPRESYEELETLSLPEKSDKRRTWMSSFTTSKVSVSIKKQMYLLIHNAAADLSVLSDFPIFKEHLDLVNQCYVTIGDPIIIDGIDVKIRDTQLLAPGVSKSLLAISTLYPNIPKQKVSQFDIENMDLFWERDPTSFKSYALQDALITLIHGCRMAHFNLELGGIGVPVTISTLSGRFLRES